MNLPACHSIIIGAMTDPHVQAVVECVPRGGLVVVDAESIPRVVRRVGLEDSVLLNVDGQPVLMSAADSPKGWIRRFAPADWDDKVCFGSHRAAQLASRLALLGAILRDPAITWLTGIDALAEAENKFVQYRAARRLGARVPTTVVDFDPDLLWDQFGGKFILKPWGPSNFRDDNGNQRVAFATRVSRDDILDTDLAEAPFIAQEFIAADRHLRVVTVGARVWVTELLAAGLPVDWRQHGPAHAQFRTVVSCPAVEEGALTLASELRAGYSSQDWIQSVDGGAYFLDLNPAGQWLFLPSATALRVTANLAQWLANRSEACG